MLDEIFTWLENKIKESSACVYELDIRDIKHMKPEEQNIINRLMAIHNSVAKKEDENFTYLDTHITKIRYKGRYYQMGYFHHEVAGFFVRYLIEKPKKFFDLTPEVKDKKSPRALYVLVNENEFPAIPTLADCKDLISQCIVNYLKISSSDELDAWIKGGCKTCFLIGHSAYVDGWRFCHGGYRIMEKYDTKLVVAGISNKDRIEPLMKYYKIWF